jgi:hypothetical protein
MAQYSLTINSVELNDNVLAIDPLPYTERNPDYSLIFDYINFELSSVNLPTITIGHSVVIRKPSATILFHGKVTDVKYNEDARSYSVEARHVLSSLETIDVLDFTWDDEVYSRERNITVNGKSWRVIQALDVFEALLHRGGYDMNRAYMQQSQSLGIQHTLESDFVGDPLYHKDVSCSLDQIYFMREQIRCMGQKGVYNWDEALDHRADATKLSDLLNILCSFTNTVIIPSTTAEFYITNVPVTPTNISNNYIYDKVQENVEAQYSGYSLRQLTAISHDRNSPYIDIYFPSNMNRRIYHDAGWNVSNYQYLRSGDADLTYGTVTSQGSITTYNHFTPIKIVGGHDNPLLITGDPYNCIYKAAEKDLVRPRIETTYKTIIWTVLERYDENFTNIEEGNRTSTIKTIQYL